MEAIDEITRRKINLNKRGVYKVAVRYEGTELVYGWTRHPSKLPAMRFYFEAMGYVTFPALVDNFIDKFFCPHDNYYYSEVNMPPRDLIAKKYKMPTNIFPYSFQRRYEAIENFDLFADKQIYSSDAKYPIADVFKYSFGLEFETSMGSIPEQECFKLGLIPLRDGSISGIEYATIKLDGEKGFSLLGQQLEALRRYTHFNKDCSLHVHLGGFPLDKDKLWNLYLIIKRLSAELEGKYLPPWSFHTGNFKANGKDYCKPLPKARSFNEFFQYVTGRNYLGSFVQPHPNDITRERKWQIPQRYHMCNFVNMFCYNVNKTIEMRFLAPTYNLEKILTWMYIFNAILIYAETKDYRGDETLLYILEKVYPSDLYKKLYFQTEKLRLLVENQVNNGDQYGGDIYLENRIFDPCKII